MQYFSTIFNPLIVSDVNFDRHFHFYLDSPALPPDGLVEIVMLSINIISYFLSDNGIFLSFLFRSVLNSGQQATVYTIHLNLHR